MTAEESRFVEHIPCPSCGSSDANSLYDDGHTHCFRCGSHGGGSSGPSNNTSNTKGRPKVAGKLIDGEVQGLRSRNITDATCAHFNYRVGQFKKKPVQIANYYSEDGVVVAQKIRTKDKDFIWLGDSKDALPFGAHSWPKTGKMLVVTEGEIDAMSMSQVQGNKWPVVSIACGAGDQTRKYMARHRDYFLGFERVVLMFDSDEPGRKAARDAAEVLGSRACIAELPLKDANEMLLAGRAEDLVTAMWRAKPYRPEGIVELSTLTDRVKAPLEMGLSWWSETLTKLTYGKRRGELYAFGAGTGVGKTDFFTQDMAHMVTVHQKPIGVFSLEQGVVETARRITGKYAKSTFHIPDSGWTKAEFDEAWEKLAGSGKVFLYDSFGVNEWSTIREKIRFLAHAEGVQDFYLDHLTALAAGEEDERKALEQIMAEMGALVKELNITLSFVSHLATPEGKPHEEGGRVMIRHFKGSRAIGFWSHFMFGLERNQQADGEAERTTTTLRVLKDRYTGRATGQVIFLGYERDTGLLYETTAPEERTSEAHGFRDETPREGEPSSDF